MSRRSWRMPLISLFALVVSVLALQVLPVDGSDEALSVVEHRLGDTIVIGWNDLGMHCMNRNFENLAVLPPFNTVWAQVIRRGMEGVLPELVQTGVEIDYSFQNNTYSVGKTDFWDWEDQLFGVSLAPNIGLAGNGLTGALGVHDFGWVVEGIPITPFDDDDWVVEQPYQLMDLVLTESGGSQLDVSTIVAPVSTEMNCDDCHHDPQGAEMAVLKKHDDEVGTDFEHNRPVLCADCHASNALGLPGNPELPSLSEAIHKEHGDQDPDERPSCMQCHPGPVTQCLRGQHFMNGQSCEDCHGDLLEVAVSIEHGRRPWLDEPDCGDCHGQDHASEPGKLFRNSRGHGGMYCEACHGSPHAIFPSRDARDNLQNIRLQGFAGVLRDCSVCHGYMPPAPGPHGFMCGDEDCFDGDDNDCDGLVDIDDPDCQDCDDLDGDGYGSPASPACIHLQEDCDDGDPDTFPGAVDPCYDGIDQNCDGADGSPEGSAYGNCSDGLDNDCDGLSDEDPECQGVCFVGFAM